MWEHAEEYQFLLQLAILLVAASLGGWLAAKISMPPVLGQILVGILIGPTVFNLVDGDNDIIHKISQIGVVFSYVFGRFRNRFERIKSIG